MTQPLEAPTADEVKAARERIRGAAYRTPLVPLNVDDAPCSIYLKLENLQPIGSFKIRGAANAMRQLSRQQLEVGVWTASAGNMAQGVAFSARQLGVPCTVVVPDTAPAAKIEAIRRLGGEVIFRSYNEWWQVMQEHRCDGVDGTFIHPVSDPAVIAGNATIALELLEDLPDVDTVLVPYGGGGLSCGIASALRHAAPTVRVLPCESDAAGPFAAALAAGQPVMITPTPSFVDGIGGRSVLTEMWPLARLLFDESLITSVADIAAAIRLIAERNHVIAEGAGAAPVAAALAGKGGSGKVVCVVSGGNLDLEKLRVILGGRVP